MAETISPSLRTLEFGNFSGINNVSDASELTPDELAAASNIDLDDKGMATRRDGFIERLSGSGIHSLWSNEQICLFVESGTLKRLATDWTSSTIRTSVSDYLMSLVDVNNIIYYSNTNVNGYITADGTDNAWADPGLDFKSKPEPAQLIEYFNGSLYFAKGAVLWHSDSMAFGRIDKRRNFLYFPDKIIMLKAVDDGLWISTGDSTSSDVFFVSGLHPKEFRRIPGAEYGALEGAAVSIDDAKAVFPELGLQGKAVIFPTKNGISVGGNNGVFINLTLNKYNVADNRFGAGLLRLQGNQYHYISTMWS